jgi:MFS transporter, BCD family, chlorophyll transporter
MTARLGWFGIFRLGLVQTALGAIVVLTTSTMNRVMVVELALPAILPGALVAFHYVLQFLRPRWGYGSDMGGRRTPWIIGGVVTLAAGGVLAAVAIAWMATNVAAGVALAALGFALIGAGVGAAGTSLLAFLANRVAEERRAAAATIVWLMMIAGFVVTKTITGHFLDPFSPARLVAITATVSVLAVIVTVLALWNIEDKTGAASLPAAGTAQSAQKPPFRDALAEVWNDERARRFSIFVFISMLAYSMQDLILEPFAGIVFGLTPGETTKLSGVQDGGVFTGMVLVALVGSAGLGFGTLRSWTMGGCIASSFALMGLALAGTGGPDWPLRATVFALGLANGAFAVSAIGSMMQLAGEGTKSREGVRMGLWGAAQAVAFGSGGFIGAAGVDVLRQVVVHPVTAYTAVFTFEAALFVVAAVLASRAIDQAPAKIDNSGVQAGSAGLLELGRGQAS